MLTIQQLVPQDHLVRKLDVVFDFYFTYDETRERAGNQIDVQSFCLQSEAALIVGTAFFYMDGGSIVDAAT